ncbi:MAG: PD40 domain-containing protein [Chloroflexi bacterium]|nr:PD40 domain-containing protein [Chloroflexota bacterium]MBE3114025.1 PD40 domain-containing protein [Actinomycetota bacterium]
MRTVTIIIIILSVAAAIIFGFIIIRYAGAKTSPPVETAESEQPDTVVEEEPEPETTEEEPQEEPDPDKIAVIEVYLDGDRNSGIPLGEAAYGMNSQQAFVIYGQDFSETGYVLAIDNKEYTFEPGSIHYLYIYALIPKYGWNYTREKIIIPGETDFDENIELHIDIPKDNEVIAEADKSNVKVSGWSVDPDSQDTTGIDRIEIYLNGPRGFGKSLGEVNYGIERQDVANALGNANYTNSGYSLNFDASNLEAGSENTIYIYSFSTSGTYYLGLRDIKMEGEEKESNVIFSVEEANLNDNSIEISGWAINILQVKPRSLDIEYSIKKIIFVSDINGSEDIYSMNLDGSELIQLTDHPGKDNYPAVSPDGKKIAYTSDINGIWQIMVMNWDGTDKTQLTQNPWSSGYPTWSFDGRFIYFEVYQDGDWEIYRINSDGSSLKRLTFNPGIYDWHPASHPFQYKVIYESGNKGNEDLYVMDYNGENPERISSINMRKRAPAISIDGKLIAFMSYEGNNSFIYIMDGNGENVKMVSGSLMNCGHPGFSPDNAFMAFESIIDGQQEIYITNPDGSNPTRLTNAAGNDSDPCFLYQTP